eukprot:6181875-Pleurochrysis_carterae.AAC.1
MSAMHARARVLAFTHAQRHARACPHRHARACPHRHARACPHRHAHTAQAVPARPVCDQTTCDHNASQRTRPCAFAGLRVSVGHRQAAPLPVFAEAPRDALPG